MALQFSVDVRNARLDAIETEIGASPTLEIRSGAAPANAATADSGTLLATMALPADFMGAAAAGVKALNGTWTEDAAVAGGTAGHFRIKQGATCHVQGTVAQSGGDMNIENTSIAIGQEITVTQFDLTEPHA